MSKTVAIEQQSIWHRTIAQRLQSLDRRHWFLITAAAAMIIFSQFRFWEQPSVGDRANWDYFAQVIARGGLPYRDVVNIKSPLSAYIGAAAILAAQPFGARDVIALRVVYVLMAALTVAFTFLVACDYFRSRKIGLLAAAVMAAFNQFAKLNSGGVQPKTPMILFGLIALWAIIKDRPFVAGLFGMLSALSWQPGLLFVGVAGLAFSRYLTSWRDLKVVKLLAGAAVPLALQLGYFWMAGGLKEFYLWNIQFNYLVYAPREARTISGFVDKLRKMLSGPYGRERVYFLLAAFGFAVAFWNELKPAIKNRLRYIQEAAPGHAIFIAPAVYFLFCAVNIQGGADLIPLLPFVAIFSAVALMFLLDRLIEVFRRARRISPAAHLERFGPAAVIALVFVFSIVDDFRFSSLPLTIKDQDAEVRQMQSLMKPDDKIFVQGTTELLVLSGLTNASPYYFMDRGKDSFLQFVESGGFDGWFERLKAQRPKIVALSRMEKVDHKEDFWNWVREDYEEREGRIFSYYVRKDG